VVVQEAGCFENYLTKMAQSGTWGDYVTLVGAAALYGKSIRIMCSDGSTFLIDSSSHLKAPAPLTLGYFGKKGSFHKYHYVSLTSKNNSNGRDGDSRLIPGTAESVAFVDVATSKDAEQQHVTNSSCRLSRADDGTTRRTTTKPDQHDETSSSNRNLKTRFHIAHEKKTKLDVVSKRQRDFAWLVPTDGGALCKTCISHYKCRSLPKDHSGVFVTKPFNNWKKSTGTTDKNNKLLKHSNSESHRTALSFEEHGYLMQTTARTVYSMVHAQSVEEQKTNLDRIADFIDAAYYLFKNEIAHTTNYNSLLALISRLDSGHIIQRFMDVSPLNATYTSHNRATEFLQAISDWLQTDLLSRIRSSPAIAILADESTDVRTRNELSVCMRFLENGMAVEAFIGLTQLTSTTAEDVKTAIMTMLQEHKIPLHKIYWMAFDGASNMSGKKMECRLS